MTTSTPRDRAKATLDVADREARDDTDQFLEGCLTDPLGRPLQQAAVHRDLQAFLTAHRKALIELPRDHGKSVQVCGRILWELGRNPGLRVKLVCATDALAAERSRFLREAIAHNPAVQRVFPDLAPGEPWAADAFTIRRPAEVIGPSVAAFGVGAGSTGARADLLVCDDVVDVRCLHSKADRDRVADYFHNNLMNLLEPDGRFWGLCTPWHADDLNARLKANPAFAVFRRAVGANLEPVWPEKWPAEKLAERLAEVGPAAFARGYRLVPIDEGEVAVRPEWVRVWDGWLPREGFETVVLAVDPAVTAKPAADASALVVLGRVADGTEVRCLEAAAHRVSAPDLVDRIAECDARWRPDVILFESNAAFAGIRDLLVRHARFGGKVRGEAQVRSKFARVAAFAVPVRNGTFRLKGDGSGGVDGSQRELFDELTTFPFAPHDDLVDAAAAGTAYLLNRPEPRVWV
jgi:phage terminase large subunit-like protein